MNPALSNYYRILAGQVLPRFKTCDLAPKIDEARQILQCCELCERLCLVDRAAGEQGYCTVGTRMSVSSAFDHYGEEKFFVPSFTVFFNCCTFACRFCQNWEISQAQCDETARFVTEPELARAIDRHSYCKNVNLVGGEPTPYVPFILETLRHVSADIAVVWNSNFYMSERSMKLLRNVVDVYLSDFKFGNDDCALRLSDAPDYSAIVRRNHLSAFKDAELVIRHLILPTHLECCTKPVLEFIAQHFGTGVVVNLMDQYRPCYEADSLNDVNRRITNDEFTRAVDVARKLGLNFVT
ncbi:MAG TPA: radical SAM protein [Candidatus Deferrimicrobium sp.]|nr:radical SAM protein [Candidatus Deferrimicrobium sp.]